MSFVAKGQSIAGQGNHTGGPRPIAVYARVSTARQEEEGTIETQMVALREFAQQNGFAIVKEFIDDGWSGDILARPALDALRQDVRSRTWQAVLIYDPDRLARRYSYQELVTDELHEAGAEVMFMTVSAPKNSEEKILHGVRGLFAEYERAKIAERFRLGKLRKVKEGHVLGGEGPYGYDYVRKKGGRQGYYVVNAAEARVVRLIFRLLTEDGLTLRRIVRKLQEQGIRPRESKRNVWSISTLSVLLRNTAYIGKAKWNAARAVVPENPYKKGPYRKLQKSSRRPRPKDEWVFIPVPPIIKKEQFERARIQLDLNGAMSKRNKCNDYLLSGKLWCACSKKRTGQSLQHGKYLYYCCSDKVRSFPLPPSCKEGNINAKVADRLVWQKLVEMMSSPQQMSNQVARWARARRLKEVDSADDPEQILEEIAKLRERESRFNRAYGEGLFALEQLREYTAPIKKRIDELQQTISAAASDPRREEAKLVPNADQIQSFANRACSIFQDLNFEQRRSIVLKAVEKIIGTQRELKVYGYFPVSNSIELRTEARYGLNAINKNEMLRIPFEFIIALPPPLGRGDDYGFGTRRNSPVPGEARRHDVQ